MSATAATDTTARTNGISHLGLTVPDLDASTAFFTDGLGWRLLGGDAEYPAAYVGDGTCVLTLWSTLADDPVPADRERNVGLHHLALQVPDLDTLNDTFERLRGFPGVEVEFAPQQNPIGIGPRVHFMVFEPGGNRMEFVCDPPS